MHGVTLRNGPHGAAALARRPVGPAPRSGEIRNVSGLAFLFGLRFESHLTTPARSAARVPVRFKFFPAFVVIIVAALCPNSHQEGKWKCLPFFPSPVFIVGLRGYRFILASTSPRRLISSP